MTEAFLKGLLESGAPWGCLCVALAIAVVTLWRRCTVLSDRLYKLSTTQVEVNTETKLTLQSVEKELRATRGGARYE